ncbi:MAG: Ig-like domain-containing protein [Kofleriaceae bacterium]
MKLALACVVAASAAVAAAPVRPQPTAIRIPRGSAPAAAVSSHIIYLHRCDVAGCTVHFGMTDDSRTSTSSIADGDRTIGGFTQPEAVWQAMLQCVKDTYAAFDVTITDVDPGNVPHFEEIVGGTPDQLRSDIPNAGGVAPFNCDEVPNGISFTFDVYGPDPDALCWTVAQETAHTFGLEHEYLQKDPMTYIPGDLPKRFQWQDAPCGTNTASGCQCNAAGTQNSYEHIYTLFGVGQPTPPTVMITSPTDGKKVTPRFPIVVDAKDDAAIDHLELWIDGAMTDAISAAPWQFTAPMLADGAHTIEIHAIDTTQMSAMTSISVTQGPPCTAAAGCEGTDVCVAGGCIPGPDAAGGLGAICQTGGQCLSLQCASAGEAFMHCVAACDPGSAGSCPNNFACLASGTGGVCWPSTAGGCCSASGDPRASLLLGMLVLGGVLRRRRS